MSRLLVLGLCCLAVIGINGEDGADSRPSITCNPQYTSTASCQNFARFCMNEINDQIRLELTASYTYTSMAAYFARDDVSYRGFAKFFDAMSTEERDHAKKLQDYVIQRGGRVFYKSIPAAATEWESPLNAAEQALVLERRVNDQLLDLHWLAQQKNDPHLQNFLEGDFLTEQVESIKKLADWVAILKRLQSDPLGWTVFDESLYQGKR